MCVCVTCVLCKVIYLISITMLTRINELMDFFFYFIEYIHQCVMSHTKLYSGQSLSLSHVFSVKCEEKKKRVSSSPQQVEQSRKAGFCS